MRLKATRVTALCRSRSVPYLSLRGPSPLISVVEHPRESWALFAVPRVAQRVKLGVPTHVSHLTRLGTLFRVLLVLSGYGASLPWFRRKASRQVAPLPQRMAPGVDSNRLNARKRVPCKWFLSPKGCQHGNACTFGHFARPGAPGARK